MYRHNDTRRISRPNLCSCSDHPSRHPRAAYALLWSTLMPSPLGERIRRLRREKGLTLDELAKLTASSKSWLWELETREAPRPSAEKLARVAAVLGVTGDFLTAAATSEPDSGVLDEAFFRKYQQLDADTKEKVRDLVERWSREE